MFHLLYVHQKSCFSCLNHSHPSSALRFHHCWVFIQSSIRIYSTHKVSLHITGSCITHERHKTPLIAFVITYLDYSFPRSRSECKHCHLMTGLWSTHYTIRSSTSVHIFIYIPRNLILFANVSGNYFKWVPSHYSNTQNQTATKYQLKSLLFKLTNLL